MPHATPDFWYRSPGLLARLLAPVGCLYGAATAYRLRHGAYQDIGIPVLCIGNLTAGGGGKTPTALAIHKLLGRENIHFPSRGYGGSLPGPVQVAPASHAPTEVGDEPLLLAAAGPCWVAKDRAAGAEAAKAAGAQAIIMDDGFQNPALRKAMSILVVKGELGFGNGQMIPAGPLRERVAAGLARTDAIICIGEPTHDSLQSLPAGIPVFTCSYRPLADDLAALTGQSCITIAGIAQPDSFPTLLTNHGITVVERISLPDHAPITDAMLTDWAGKTERQGVQLVTTAKDWVRLPTVWRSRIRQVRIKLDLAEPAQLKSLIDSKIAPLEAADV